MPRNNQHKKLLLPMLQLKRELPRIVDTMLTTALRFFIMSFRNQGFTDTNFQAWPRRKRLRDAYRRGNIRNASGGTISLNMGRAILVKSGELRRSLHKKKLGLTRGAIVSDKPYANIHNEGLTGKAWGKYTFKMRQRKFVGYSETLHKNLTFVIQKRISNIFGYRLS